MLTMNVISDEQMAQVTANGINIEVEEYGDKSNQTLMLVCGWSVQLTYWPQAFIQACVDAGYHVVVFDNRDSGLSHKTRGLPLLTPFTPGVFASRARGKKTLTPYTLEDMADDAIGVLDALKIKSAHVLGLSMGGMISQIVSSKYPNRIRSLTVLMSTTNRRGLPRGSRRLALDVFIGRPPLRRSARIRRSLRLWNKVGTPYGGYDPDLVELALTAATDRCYTPQGRRRQMQAILATGDIRRWTRKITVPALVVHGSVDPLLPPHAGIDVASNISGARFELIDGLAHDLPPSKLDVITNLVVDHLNSAA